MLRPYTVDKLGQIVEELEQKEPNLKEIKEGLQTIAKLSRLEWYALVSCTNHIDHLNEEVAKLIRVVGALCIMNGNTLLIKHKYLTEADMGILIRVDDEEEGYTGFTFHLAEGNSSE